MPTAVPIPPHRTAGNLTGRVEELANVTGYVTAVISVGSATITYRHIIYEAVPVIVIPVTVYSPAALKAWSPVSVCHP